MNNRGSTEESNTRESKLKLYSYRSKFYTYGIYTRKNRDVVKPKTKMNELEPCACSLHTAKQILRRNQIMKSENPLPAQMITPRHFLTGQAESDDMARTPDQISQYVECKNYLQPCS